MTLKIDRESADQLRKLRKSQARTIVEMAQEIGVDFLTFFEGEDWSGLDLRTSDLEGISFADAILDDILVYRDQLETILRTSPRSVSRPKVYDRPKPLNPSKQEGYSASDRKDFGKVVRRMRLSQGWSQAILARKAFGNAKQKRNISRLEHGKLENLRLTTVWSLCRSLKISPNDIPTAMRWSGNPDLAIVAGTGDLPSTLVSRLSEVPLICALDGFAPSLTPDVVFRLEQFGTFLKELKERGIKRVCMVGAVERPSIDPSKIDSATAPLIPMFQTMLMNSDEAAARAIISLFEDAGFVVAAPHDIAPDLLPPVGVLTRTRPTYDQALNASIGEAFTNGSGSSKRSQACVVLNEEVIASGDDRGTIAMLEGLVSTQNHRRSGLTLFLASVPGEERRVDLPPIGIDVATKAIDVGVTGIVIEAAGVMVLDLKEVRAVLDEAGCYLWVRPKGG